MQLELPIEQHPGHSLFTLPEKPTREEIAAICAANPNVNLEVTAEGTIVIMAPTGIETSHRNGRIALQLMLWADRDGRGVVFESNAMFTLPNGAMRSPDAAWISSDRLSALPAGEEETFARIVPDFVIELKSKSDRLKDTHAKMLEWMEQGATLGWLIDPERREVFVYRAAQIDTPSMPEKLTAPAQVEGEGPVAGFVLEMDQVWKKLRTAEHR